MPELLFEGSLNIIVPFLFVFAIVFGVLQVANVFKNRAVNFVIALAIGLFAISNAALVTTLHALLPNVTWFFIVLFFFVFVFELLGLRKEGKSHTESMITSGGVLFVLLSLSFMVLQVAPSELPFIGSAINLVFILGLIFILAIFWAALKIGVGAVPGGGKGE